MVTLCKCFIKGVTLIELSFDLAFLQRVFTCSVKLSLL